MKLEIISHKKNQLMGREEAEIKVYHHGQRTPSRQEMLKEVAGHLKAQESHVIINSIMTIPGDACSHIKAHAYEKAESVPAYKAEKMKRRMKAAKGEAKAEAEPAAKPKKGE